jgi:opine dehydrogenase
MKVKNRVRAAALPASETDRLMQMVQAIYPEYAAATNVLETSINNTGAVVHPAPMLLNSGLLERAAKGEDLRYYRDIITRYMCDNVMEKIDREKSAVARALNVPVLDIRGWYKECYDIEGDDIYSTLQNNHYYEGFSAPKHVLSYHHVLDEVPNSLVPLAFFGDAVGVDMAMTTALVDLASAMLAHDFWKEGRTLEKLGVHHMTPDEMLTFVNEGPCFWER